VTVINHIIQSINQSISQFVGALLAEFTKVPPACSRPDWRDKSSIHDRTVHD